MFSKKVELNNEVAAFDELSPILRKKEYGRICQVNEFAERTKKQLQTITNKRIDKIQALSKDKFLEARTQALADFVAEIQRMQKEKAQYFNLIEQHCRRVLTKSMTLLVADFDDQVKVESAIKSALAYIDEGSEVLIELHEDHLAELKPYLDKLGWEVKARSTIAKDLCKLSVNSCEYESSFAANIELFRKLIDKY